MVRKRRLRLGSAPRSHFPAPRRRLEVSPPKSAQEQQGTKEQSQRRVRSLVPRMVTKERPTDLEGQTRAQLIMARSADLHTKAEYICADLSSRPNFPLQSRGGPYIPDTNRVNERIGDYALIDASPCDHLTALRGVVQASSVNTGLSSCFVFALV